MTIYTYFKTVVRHMVGVFTEFIFSTFFKEKMKSCEFKLKLTGFVLLIFFFFRTSLKGSTD